MSARWYRCYADMHRHPKVARLSDRDFRLWHELLAVAAENDGHIPPLEDLKHLLKARLDHLSCALKRLSSAGLIDPLSDGFEPHNWAKRQYKSDTSTERVRKHRGKGNVSGNVSETPPDTETDTETEKKEVGGAKAPSNGSYAFIGRVVKLEPGDLDEWRRTYHAIPDIEAELASIDAWLVEHPPNGGKWFHPTKGMLNRKHQDILAAKAVSSRIGVGI